MSRHVSTSSRSNNNKDSRTEGPDRRQRRSAETRERLFRAALRLFAEQGFAETTVEDITNAADVGKGTFFNYFPSKEHILIAFSDMQLSKLQATVDQMRARPEPMRSFFRAMTLRMTEEPSKSPDVVRARKDCLRNWCRSGRGEESSGGMCLRWSWRRCFVRPSSGRC